MKIFLFPNARRTGSRYLMVILAGIGWYSCSGNTTADPPPVPATTIITPVVQADTSLNGFYRYIIDTTRQFPDIKALLDFRNAMGKQMWAYKQYFLRNSTRPDAGFVTDSVTQYEQELFFVSLYKHLLRLPKEQSAFNMLGVLEYAHLVSVADKEALFNLYPAAMRTSAKGKELLAKLLPLKAHLGMSMTGFGNLPLTHPRGNTVPLASVMGSKQTLLVFGASWCSPCKHQDIIIEKLIAAQQIDTATTRILYLSVDEKPGGWQRFIAGFAPGTRLYLLAGGFNNAMLKKLAIVGIPHYLLLDNTMAIKIEGQHIKDVLPAIAPKVDLNTIF
jgi:thiol-disulfide isomerase/thioredoxin